MRPDKSQRILEEIADLLTLRKDPEILNHLGEMPTQYLITLYNSITEFGKSRYNSAYRKRRDEELRSRIYPPDNIK